MSIRSNTPDGYRPFSPNDPNVLFSQDPDSAPQEREGLYFRRDMRYDYDELSRALQEGGSSSNFLLYQYWAESAWKTEQGTYSSAERFTNKLEEEHLEFKTAVDEFYHRKANYDPVLAENVVLEAGDVLWCMTALASNASADIDAGMRTLLFRYVRGTQHVRNMVAVKPPWRDMAGSLAVKYEQLTLKDIDQLINRGFEPQPTQVMNIFEPDDDQFDIDQHLFFGRGVIAAMSNRHLQQYGYGDDLSESPASLVMLDKFNELGHEIAELTSQALLETLFVAKRVLPGLTMDEILRKNVEKISHRVHTRQVDKTDGDRQPH
jgi:hypothetical protein